VVFVLLSATVQSAEDGEKEGLEAKAAALLADEERSEEMIHREAMHPVNDNDPPAPWEVDQKKAMAAQEEKNEEARVAARIAKVQAKHAASNNQDDEPDLGESGPDLGESASVAVSDANAMTARAHASAQASMHAKVKTSAMQRAKAIADKVKKLVSKQQSLEQTAGKKVKGSLLDQANTMHDEAVQRTARDALLAHKLENEQAMDTMQHLMETERDEQHKAFEKERSTTHGMLHNLRAKLQGEQKKMVKQIRTETTDAVVNVEKELSKSAIASTIQKVVQKNLAKRVAELKAVGEKTVHDVASQVTKLKHRVRRLRREQERMKVAEESMEQKTQLRTLSESQMSKSRDLGESQSQSGMNPMTFEMEKMRMEQQMQQQQMQQQMQMQQMHQQQVQQQQPVQMQQQMSSFQMEEHKQLLAMKQQMESMQAQNARLTEMLMARPQASQPAPAHYSHNELAKLFQKKKQSNGLMDQVTQELQSHSSAATPQLQLPGTETMLVELAEGEQTHALPIYNQHAEQARVEMEELHRRALEDSLSMA
jgi:hypothetical protein